MHWLRLLVVGPMPVRQRRRSRRSSRPRTALLGQRPTSLEAFVADGKPVLKIRWNFLVRDKEFNGETVHLDGRIFVKCTFTDCMIVFSATAPMGLNSSKFENCNFSLSGAAGLTIDFLTVL